jgi:beta-lactamase regulating signal transducer with metallopeptidase domain
MPVLLSYCLKLSVSLAMVSLFYQLVLRKLTFYNWNRYYLLGYSLLSFFVAFIDISPILQQSEWTSARFVQWVPVLSSEEIITTNTGASRFFTTWNVVGLLLITGIGVMFFRLLFQLFSFRRMMKKAKFISAQGMKFYQVDDPIIPFSFGNSIFINPHLHTEKELKEIIRHEFVHVKQRHSVDIILSEIICLLNWYNPFSWLLRASIRQNLEFIADDRVLQNGINKKDYQYLLLKVIGNNQFSIAQKFNFSSLKKRIAMMNRLKSTRLNLVKFLFILPLVIILLLAFRNRGSLIPTNNHTVLSTRPIVTQPHEFIDTVPKPGIISNEKKLSSVSDDYEINDERAVIHLKNGTTEEYDLKNKEQRKKFEEKYGKIINTAVHVGPMTTVSAVTAVAPVTITSNSNTNLNTNTNVNTNSNIVVATPVGVSTAATIVSSATVNIEGTTVIAPVAATSRAVMIADDNGYTITGQEEVLITITKHTTRQQLDEFKKQMKEKGIELSFDEIEYDDNGVLIRLRGMVKSKDNNSSFSASGFNKLILSMITDGDHFYFRVRTTNNKVVI